MALNTSPCFQLAEPLTVLLRILAMPAWRNLDVLGRDFEGCASIMQQQRLTCTALHAYAHTYTHLSAPPLSFHSLNNDTNHAGIGRGKRERSEHPSVQDEPAKSCKRPGCLDLGSTRRGTVLMHTRTQTPTLDRQPTAGNIYHTHTHITSSKLVLGVGMKVKGVSDSVCDSRIRLLRYLIQACSSLACLYPVWYGLGLR